MSAPRRLHTEQLQLRTWSRSVSTSKRHAPQWHELWKVFISYKFSLKSACAAPRGPEESLVTRATMEERPDAYPTAVLTCPASPVEVVFGMHGEPWKTASLRFRVELLPSSLLFIPHSSFLIPHSKCIAERPCRQSTTEIPGL